MISFYEQPETNVGLQSQRETLTPGLFILMGRRRTLKLITVTKQEKNQGKNIPDFHMHPAINREPVIVSHVLVQLDVSDMGVLCVRDTREIYEFFYWDVCMEMKDGPPCLFFLSGRKLWCSSFTSINLGARDAFQNGLFCGNGFG